MTDTRRILFAAFLGCVISATLAAVIHGVVVTNTVPAPTAKAK